MCSLQNIREKSAVLVSHYFSNMPSLFFLLAGIPAVILSSVPEVYELK